MVRIEVAERERLVGGSEGRPTAWTMTLDRADWRDLFAASVASAVVARAGSPREDPAEVAAWAYLLADAMVEAQARWRR